MPPPQLVAPPRWTAEQLDKDRIRAIEIFRKARLEEPLEVYLEAFDAQQQAFEDLLELTVDLTQVRQHAVAILTDRRLRDALRYVAGPPLSDADWKTVADAASWARKQLKTDPAAVDRLIEAIFDAMDRRRFPWISEGRLPDESTKERASAVVASAALVATRRSETARRSDSKAEQETFVEDMLSQHGLVKVVPKPVHTLSNAPAPGQFCRESMLGNRKADFIVGLYDGRTLALECKVSNSALNSIKRLNNDAAVKAEIWRKDFGDRNVVPGAVLSGVYKLHQLEDAQQRGLTLFWSHDLVPQLLGWIDQTKAL